MRAMNDFKTLYNLANSIGIYRNVVKSPLVRAFLNMLRCEQEDFYESWGDFISELSRTGSLNFFLTASLFPRPRRGRNIFVSFTMRRKRNLRYCMIFLK